MHEYKDNVPLSTGQIRRGNVCVNFIPMLQAATFSMVWNASTPPKALNFAKIHVRLRTFRIL